MNILYVYAHPQPHSFNELLKTRGLAYLTQHQHHIQLSDLYKSHFKANADWQDFTLEENKVSTQYFLAQQQAYQQQQISTDIQAELAKIKWAEHIILQFPFWWFSMPAILKGWLDRTLVKGFAYDAGKVFADGLLRGKTASLVISTQSPESAYQVDGLHGATIETFLHPIYHTLRFVGIQPLAPFVAYGAFNLEDVQREKILGEYEKYLGLM